MQNRTPRAYAPRLVLAAALLLSSIAAVARAQQDTVVYSVSYVSGTAVYLDAGRAEGLHVGDRLRLLRSGETLAEVEVAFVADHSASCRILTQTRSVQQGDQAFLLTPTPEQELPPSPPAEEPIVEPVVPRQPVVGPGEPALGRVRREPRSRWSRWSRPSGSVSMRWHSFQQSQQGAGSFDEQTARLNLRLREMGRMPLDLRVRMRSRQVSRDSRDSERSDRLYELSLSYEPPDGRFSLQLGRLAANPFVGIGYLDGAMGQLRLTRSLYAGAFYGKRPVIEELGFESTGQKLGGFLRLSTQHSTSRRFAEVVLAGVSERESGSIVSREYVSLDTRLGAGSRWSLFQRAELDLDRTWADTAAQQDSQLSLLTFAGSVRFSDKVRASVTYDQRRNYRVFETRNVPEDFFDDLLREGLRASLYFGEPIGWNFSTSVGARRQEGGGDPTYSGGVSLYHRSAGRSNLLLGGDVSVYTGGITDGYLATLRAARYFRGGHDLSLTVGTSVAKVAADSTEFQRQWVRLSGTIQLPRRFFLLLELEQNSGDDLEGQRYRAELGYRF